MQVLVWILGVLTLLVLLLLFLRVGVRVELGETGNTIDLKVGPFHFRVFPGKSKPKKPEEPTEKPVKSADQSGEQKKSGMKFSPAAILDLLRTIWPPLRRGLERTRRSIRVKPLRLSLTIGGEEDPAAAAQLYGELHGAVWTLMPILEELLVIYQPYVHIGLDFDTAENRVEGSFGLSIRVGTVLGLLFGVGIPAFRWLLRQNRQEKTEGKTPARS